MGNIPPLFSMFTDNRPILNCKALSESLRNASFKIIGFLFFFKPIQISSEWPYALYTPTAKKDHDNSKKPGATSDFIEEALQQLCEEIQIMIISAH